MANYKIISFSETSGQLVIEYAVGMAPVAIDVPLVNGLFITGVELDNYIQGFIPHEYLSRQAQLNAGIPNAADIKSLVEEPTSVELPSVLTPEQEQAIENQKMWLQQKFDSDVAKVLVKFGLLETDPTIIPVSVQ